MMELLERNFKSILTWSLLTVIIVLLIFKENVINLPQLNPTFTPALCPLVDVQPNVTIIADYSFGNITIRPDRLFIIAQNVTVVQANYTWNVTGHIYNIEISEGIGIITST